MDRETLFQYIEEYLEYQAQQRLEDENEDIEIIIDEQIIPELKLDLIEYLGKF